MGIKGLGDKKGSSRQAMLKYVVANNKVDADKAAVRVKLALRKLIASKKGAGSYKLTAAEKKPKEKKVKKPKAKKPAKKAKKPAKKAAKKPAAKKPAAKKPAAKKAAKKPAAKKA